MKRLTSWLFKKLRGVFRTVFLYCLPQKLRHALYRRMIHVQSELPEGIRFKVAETKEELIAAFTLLHDTYVRMGYMDPHPSGMRLTKYHTLPSTTTLIALDGDKVIATMSLIRSSAFGIPSESAFDMQYFKKAHASYGEASALAVDPRYAKENGAVLFPLMKFMYEYVINYFGLKYLIIVVSPKWFEFYQSILFFKLISMQKIEYKFVNGAPGVAGFSDLRAFYSQAAAHYGKNKQSKNLFHFFTELQLKNFDFPHREYSTISDPVMTPELLNFFFNEQSHVLAEMTEREKHILNEIYDTDAYRKVLPKTNTNDTSLHFLRDKRFEVLCPGRITVPGQLPVRGYINNVSMTGLRGVFRRSLRVGEEYRLQIALNEFDIANLVVMPVYISPQGFVGLRICKSPKMWGEFIQSMNLSLNKAA